MEQPGPMCGRLFPVFRFCVLTSTRVRRDANFRKHIFDGGIPLDAGDLVEGTSTGISQGDTHGATENESAGVADLCMYVCVHTLPVIMKSFYRIKACCQLRACRLGLH